MTIHDPQGKGKAALAAAAAAFTRAQRSGLIEIGAQGAFELVEMLDSDLDPKVQVNADQLTIDEELFLCGLN